MRVNVRGLSPLLVALLALGCGAPPEPAAAPSDVRVELDAYSGRPNPVWTLTSEEAAELARRLRALPELPNAAPSEATLGYRGFRVHNPGGDHGIPEQLYVSREGTVWIDTAAGRRLTLRDDGGVEEHLVLAALRHGHRVPDRSPTAP